MMARTLSFEETVETVGNWIASCKNELQLNMCKEAVKTFVKERFEHYAEPVEMAKKLDYLDTLIEIRKQKIIGIGLEIIT